MHDIAEFLRGHDPFAQLDEQELEALAARTQVEFFAAGAVIYTQGQPPLDHVLVVRRGNLELMDQGRVLDMLGEGELVGHPSMLSGLPTGWAVRAGEDTLCYRLAAEDVTPLLARPEGLRYLARSLLARPRRGASAVARDGDAADMPGRRLVHEPPVVCTPDTSIREAARRMADERATCVLVDVGDGEVGIVTDNDMRVRVVAEGTSTDEPLSRVMTAPAVTAGADRPGSELLLTMIDNAIRHLPVLSERGKVIGVVTDTDLLAVHARSPLVVRRAIEDARDMAELRAAAHRLGPTVVELFDGRTSARNIAAITASVLDAVVRRVIDMQAPDEPRHGFVWLALGSFGRREPVPSSDADSALAWDGGPRPEMVELAKNVVVDLESAGFPADRHGSNAANPFFARPVEEFRAAMRAWLADPIKRELLVPVSLFYDARQIAGDGTAPSMREMLAESENRGPLLRLLGRLALAQRPPTGFLRDIVVEHGGQHGGRFDIKRGGLLPIVDIARYAGGVAGSPYTSTPERLRAGAQAGVLRPEEARTLEEAFDLFASLRLEHQVEQLRASAPPDDFVHPRALNNLTRRYVREAFRAVSSVQRGLSSGMTWN
ncbi:MAG TPA: putative nucleotidyltransferase substrate binding domain-containing protein [Thermoleophilaceae bacterium]